MDAFLPSGGGINFSKNGGCKITDYKNTLNISFYCRKSKQSVAVSEAPVEVSLIINGKRCFINLPFKVNPKEFNRKKPSTYIADYLVSMRTTMNSIITEMQVHHVPLTAETLRQAWVSVK